MTHVRRWTPRRAVPTGCSRRERALQRPQAVDAAAAEAGGLSNRIEPLDRLAGCVEHPALQVGPDAAEALAADDVLTNRNQRQCLGLVDRLEFAQPDPVATVLAQCRDAAQ